LQSPLQCLATQGKRMPDERYLPDDQQEDLEDLGEEGLRYSAVINSADWTVQTIIQQINKKNIELNPSFQRRQAWRSKRKSLYIESLILNVPVPQIVLAERKDARGKFIVIDGKQRLLALRQFYSSPEDSVYKSFKLSDLTIRTDLNGLGYSDLELDLIHEPDVTVLDNSTIRTAVIKNWKEESFLYTVFLRLNTGSVQLSPQELRQALHPGPFLKFVDEYSIESDLLKLIMHLKEPDVRMRDAELVIRFFAFRNFLHTYTGNLKPLLDDTAEYFNSHWESDQDKIKIQKEEFERSINTAVTIFGEDNVFRKWNGTKYESAFNRAIFDAVILSFINKTVSECAIQNKNLVEDVFKKLCVQDERFKSSVEGTTKAIHSIFARLQRWAEVLKGVLGDAVPVPELIDNKIVLNY